MIVDIILKIIVLLLVNVFSNQSIMSLNHQSHHHRHHHHHQMLTNNGVHMVDILNQCIQSMYFVDAKQKGKKFDAIEQQLLCFFFILFV